MNETLQPCPFCGGEAVHTESSYFRDTLIYCENCDAYFTVDSFYADENDVIEAWNRRAEPERKKGEWIDGLPYVNSHWWVCSVCHIPAPENHTGYNFCPNCGARMTRGE